MSYPITVNLIAGLPKNPYRHGVGAYEGVVAHSTATPEATAGAERAYESTHWNDAFVHFFVDWTSIIQVADTNYLSWNSGPQGNSRFVGVELCETKDPAKFQESYARYTWLLAKILHDKGLGVKRQSTLWTHHDVSSILGGSDHTDPDVYLAGHGVTIDKLVADVAAQYNAMNAPVAPKPAPTPSNLYRVRKTWADAASQLGAFSSLDGAKSVVDQHPGYNAYDESGKQVYPVAQPTPAPVTHMYRVRKSWADASSQIGAFSDLNNAKDLADKNPGYIVFDETGKALYQNVAETPKEVAPTPAPAPAVEKPAEVTPAPTPAPAPAPEPQPAPVVPGHPIMGESVAVAEQMAAFVETVNPSFDIEIAKAFLSVGKKYGIRGDVAFSQSIVETGYFKFDGGTAVTPDQHNYAGIGVTSKGMKGNSFGTIEEGVTAQLQHLLAYASKDAIPAGDAVLDPRFALVTRGIAPNWEDLNNRWAMNSAYGQSILAVYDKVLATPVPVVIEKPAPQPAPVVEPKPVPAPVETPVVAPADQVDNPDEKINGGLINRVLRAILNFLTGKKN